MTERNAQDSDAQRWSVVAETSSHFEAQDWDDYDDEILRGTQDADTQDSSAQATPVEKESSTEKAPVGASDLPLAWKWALTDKAFVARPDPDGDVFHAQLFEDLGVTLGEGISGTFTLHKWTIRYRAYDPAGSEIDDQTRRRFERELLTWAERGGPDAALDPARQTSPKRLAEDDGRSTGSQ